MICKFNGPYCRKVFILKRIKIHNNMLFILQIELNIMLKTMY